MRVLFAGKKERGISGLRALAAAGHEIVGVIAHPDGTAAVGDTFAAEARLMGFPVRQPEKVNDPAFIDVLRPLAPEVIVLAGYGQIVRRPFIDLAPLGCINLHAGKLPQYRGSSPLNWALINGEREIGLSIVRVDEGVDTGDVFAERAFPVGIDDTIADLHALANRNFPEMLLETLDGLSAGTLVPRKQDGAKAGYWPLRFPDDGLILWDTLSAVEIHNRIRALTDPYPGAFGFLGERRVRILKSHLAEPPYHGEPGRIYRKTGRGILVGARDRCLWIARAVFADTGEDAVAAAVRYEKFGTLRDAAINFWERRGRGGAA